MTAFEGFSEAAQLYAQHFAVVNEMQRHCRGEILQFLDALQADIQGLVTPLQLQTYSPGDSRYWWIAEPQQDRDDFARLSIDMRNPEIVWPGRLAFVGQAVRATDEQRAQVLELLASPTFQRYVTQRQGRPWNLFRFTVEYGTLGDLTEIAQPITELLGELSALGPLNPSV